MKVSARNVFEGTVSAVQPGAVNAEVELTLAGGEKLVAVVTMTSLHNLGINVGKQAVALVKAPWVVLMTDAAGYRLSARNALEGEVVRIGDGAVNAEVVLSWPVAPKCPPSSPAKRCRSWAWRPASRPPR